MDHGNPLSAAARHFLNLWKMGPTPFPLSALTTPILPPPQNALPSYRSLNSCTFTHPSSSFNVYASTLMRLAHTLFDMGVQRPCINLTYLKAPSVSLDFGAHTPSLFTYKDKWLPSPKYLQQPWPGFHGFIIKLLHRAITILPFLHIWEPSPSSNRLII